MVVGEGLKDAEGNEIGADKSKLDAFGTPFWPVLPISWRNCEASLNLKPAR